MGSPVCPNPGGPAPRWQNMLAHTAYDNPTLGHLRFLDTMVEPQKSTGS